MGQPKNTTSCVQDSDYTIEINVLGMGGYVDVSSYGLGMHGKWASHSGFRHVVVSTMNTSEIQSIAEGLYREQSPLCYLVGDEHKEFGWKTIRVNMDDLVEVRLPQWADQAIKDALSSIGMTMACPSNYYWTFPKGIGLQQAKEALDPLLQTNTRLAYEVDLAAKLSKNFPSTELGFRETQLSLF